MDIFRFGAGGGRGLGMQVFVERQLPGGFPNACGGEVFAGVRMASSGFCRKAWFLLFRCLLQHFLGDVVFLFVVVQVSGWRAAPFFPCVSSFLLLDILHSDHRPLVGHVAQGFIQPLLGGR